MKHQVELSGLSRYYVQLLAESPSQVKSMVPYLTSRVYVRSHSL